MKYTLLLALSILICQFGNAQNTSLRLDGVNDHVDLGNECGNNVRTIEFWFKLDTEITPNLGNFKTVVAREISGINGNTDEFTFSFQPSFVQNPGTLRFDVDGTAPYKSVFSDNNTWPADQWYHAAAVIHPVTGMSLFVNGIKQESTHPHSTATADSDDITTIGCWGKDYIRYFKGQIDDLRFSSEPLYEADFTPTCPDLKTMSATIGLWNFNSDSGQEAIDSSANAYHGEMVGASKVMAIVCVDPNTSSTTSVEACDFYDSPSGNYTWDVSGVYMDTIPNSTGADSVMTIDLTINTVNTNITTNNMILVSEASDAMYQWIDCDNGNNPIVGEVNQTFAPGINGSYAVIVTENGCTATSECFDVMVVGIADVDFDQRISISPNPAQETIFIDLKKVQSAAVVKLFGINGQLINTQGFNNSKNIEMDLDVVSGIYLLEVTDEKGMPSTFKLLKQ